MDSPADFTELLGRARRGDRSAMDELIRTLRPFLLKQARSFSGPHAAPRPGTTEPATRAAA